MTRAIRRLFVANRGEIAARIARTAERLGVETVIAATDGPAKLDLLDPGAVVHAALAAGADALHPGYGFLAENAGFAEAVEAAGIAWVGPPPSAIRVMGDKAGARRLAAQLGVPVVPGYDGPDQGDEQLAAAAAAIGYPLLVKPAAGGGGKGMRRVAVASDLPGAFASARREALAAFGDDRLILERLVGGPRHIEIQVLFDASGHGVHLGERDCSLQRRHQKVLEETPSPALDAALRQRMGEAALRLASAAGYRSAGTVEFLLGDGGEFWFLEMNTRLQVEHGVTEAVTGRDLVADQLRIAAGEALGFEQPEVLAHGHAVEVRLYAEDAEAGFLPATGPVLAVRWPVGEGIRVDAGVAQGDTVGARFDPLLAKIIAHGADRADALNRLATALDDTVVLGLVTNLRFLRWVVRHPVVRAGEVRTDTLEAIWPIGTTHQPRPDQGELAAAARVLAGDPTLGTWGGGWRLNAPAVIALEVDGTAQMISPGPRDPTAPFVSDRDAIALDVDGRSVRIRLAGAPDVERAARAAGLTAGGSALTAPMPGRVIAVLAEGATVDVGDPVATLEAMKMEHVVAAPSAGRLVDVAIAIGDQVAKGQSIARVE